MNVWTSIYILRMEGIRTLQRRPNQTADLEGGHTCINRVMVCFRDTGVILRRWEAVLGGHSQLATVQCLNPK